MWYMKIFIKYDLEDILKEKIFDIYVFVYKYWDILLAFYFIFIFILGFCLYIYAIYLFVCF